MNHHTPSRRSSSPYSWDRAALLFGLGVILMGIWLRGAYVDFNGLIIDELYTLDQVQYSFGRIIDEAVEDVHPPFFYMLGRLAWMALGGDTMAVRWFSWAVAAITLVLFWLLAQKIGGPRYGLVAAALLSLSPFHFFYSSHARNYALGALLVTIQLFAAWYLMAPDAPRRQLRWATLAYFLAGVAACYTHLLLVFVIFFQGIGIIGLMGAHRRWSRFRRALLIHIGLFVLFLPWLFVSFYQAGRMGDALKWMAPPRPEAMWRAFSTNMPLGAFYSIRTRFDPEFYTLGEAPAFLWIGGAINPLLLALVAAAGLAAAWHLRRRPIARSSPAAAEQNARKDFVLLLLLLTLGPLILAYLVSAYYVRVFFPPRFAIFHLPPFILLMCAGLIGLEGGSPAVQGLSRRRKGAIAVGYGIAVLWLAAQVQLLGAYHLRPPFNEARQALEAAKPVLSPGEPLAYTTSSTWGIKEVEFNVGETLPGHEAIWLPDLLDELAGLPTGGSWKTPLETSHSAGQKTDLPRHITVFDWMSAEDPNSGKRGAFALFQLRRFAGEAETVYDPLMAPRYLALQQFEQIDWPALLGERRLMRSQFAPIQHLPWHDLRDAGGHELLEYNGFAQVDYLRDGLRRWLLGGDSHFYYDWYEGALPPGEHWFVACFWRRPGTAARTSELGNSAEHFIETTITNTEVPEPTRYAKLQPGYNIVAIPFNVIEGEYDVGILVNWRYSTWVPAETPGGGPDPRALGPSLIWFGTLSAAEAENAILSPAEIKTMLQPSGHLVIIPNISPQ